MLKFQLPIYNILLCNLDVIAYIFNKYLGFSIVFIAIKVCEFFSFYDSFGNFNIEECLEAILKLHKENYNLNFKKHNIYISKVINNTTKRNNNAKFIDQNYSLINIDENIDFQCVLVTNDYERNMWKSCSNINKTTKQIKVVGHQLLYYIKSDKGVLASFSVSSAALSVKYRDNYIGWTKDEKKNNLKYVIRLQSYNFSYDCIRNQSLTEKIVGELLKVIPNDFENKYGYKPLLIETFVFNRYNGCMDHLLNNNFINVGMTSGIGRNGLKNFCRYRKNILLYEIDKDFRQNMNLNILNNQVNYKEYLEEKELLESLSQKSIIDEFKDSDLGDARRTKSLLNLVTLKYDNMGDSICKSCRGNKTNLVRAYRLLDNKSYKINFNSLQENHRINTMKRMKKAKSVFIIVDATDFNFNNLKHCRDLGVISVKKGGSTSSGLRLYSALAFDENFNPLGVIYAKLVSPQLRTEEERKNAKNIPQEDKETQIWLDIYHHIEEIKSVFSDTKFTYIADRGADFYNFWLAYDAKKLVNLTIRAKHDRSLIDNNKLFSSVKKEKVVAKDTVYVSKLSSRSLDDAGRQTRLALVSIRAKNVTIVSKNKNDVNLNIIYVKEETKPLDDKRVEWFILTTESINTPEEIINIVDNYSSRWRIEVWHKILKSDGCNAEHIIHRSKERIARSLAIDMILSWHLMLTRDITKNFPDIKAGEFYEKREMKILNIIAKERGVSIEKYKDALYLQASLGGYLYKHNTYPGFKSMRDGKKILKNYCYSFKLCIDEIVKELYKIVKDNFSIGADVVDNLIKNISENCI